VEWPGNHLDEFSVIQNGQSFESPWSSARVSWRNSEEMAVSAGLADSTVVPFLSQSIYIPNIPRRLGTFNLHTLKGKDQVSVTMSYVANYTPSGRIFYDLDPSEDAFISIDYYNIQRCTIRGTFAFTVIQRDVGIEYPNVADTLRLNEGRFYTDLFSSAP